MRKKDYSKSVSMKKVELHCHSNASPDGLNSAEEFEKFLNTTDLDVLAITDHNTIQTAAVLKKHYPDRILIGEEIEVTWQGEFIGELLAYFVQEEIQKGEDVIQVIKRLQQQEAYISIAHPMDRHRSRWSLELLNEIMPMIDGVEVFNSRCVHSHFNEKAFHLAEQYEKQFLVGSDAHCLWEVGTSFHRLESVATVNQFKKSLGEGRRVVRRSPLWVHGLSRLAVLRNQLFKP